MLNRSKELAEELRDPKQESDTEAKVRSCLICPQGFCKCLGGRKDLPKLQEHVGLAERYRMNVSDGGRVHDIENDITGRLVAAGRALVEVGREDFAKVSGLSVDALVLLEAGGSAWIQSESDAEAIVRAFDAFGVVKVMA